MQTIERMGKKPTHYRKGFVVVSPLHPILVLPAFPLPDSLGMSMATSLDV